MSSNTEQISTEEQEQILQTIEMFEVITQSNPNDCQSLEVLKEAYWRLGRKSDAIGVTRRLADTYMSLGQYASAMLEYEGILRKEPENSEVEELLREVEGKLNQAGLDKKEDGPRMEAVDFGALSESDANLIRTGATVRPEDEMGETTIDLGNDGNDALCKFLTQHRLAAPDSINACLDRIRKQNQATVLNPESGVARSLLGELCETNAAELDVLLCGILDRTKLAYVPLDYYDVDRQIVKMLPESLTLGRLIVPFDLISRTVMIAMANPFDGLGKEAVQQLFDYNIQWHVAAPEAITKVLKEVYRIDQEGRK